MPHCAAHYARVRGKRLFSSFLYATYKHNLDDETRTCSTRRSHCGRIVIAPNQTRKNLADLEVVDSSWHSDFTWTTQSPTLFSSLEGAIWPTMPQSRH